ncbi:MAG TPA: hypothetical protein IGS40_28075 [Trichormus sp. M33_DOE_039]|nr:hypothetical protein [Trichormus sp. M33_DOE_039]
MNRMIYIGIMALPIYFLHNASVNFISHSEAPSFSNKHEWFLITTKSAQNTKTQLQKRSWQIADGRDQTEDCLRTGECTI